MARSYNLSIKTTCVKTPYSVGPKGGLYIQVGLYYDFSSTQEYGDEKNTNEGNTLTKNLGNALGYKSLQMYYTNFQNFKIKF